MNVPSNFEDLIAEVNQLDLYKKLVLQLNKDFLRANVDLNFHEEVLPTSLKLVLHETVYTLIQEKFGDGIMSAIDFDMTVTRVENPKGDRVKVEMSGKYLGYNSW